MSGFTWMWQRLKEMENRNVFAIILSIALHGSIVACASGVVSAMVLAMLLVVFAGVYWIVHG